MCIRDRIGADNIVLDGQNYTGSYTGLNGSYRGLIRMPTTYKNVTIRGINIDATGKLCVRGAGWVVGSYFAKGGSSVSTYVIENCSSNGNISPKAGGIVGYFANCGSSSSKRCSGTIEISYCYSTGSIDHLGGGILGAYSNYGYNTTTTTTIIRNCYVATNTIYSSVNPDADLAGTIAGAGLGVSNKGKVEIKNNYIVTTTYYEYYPTTTSTIITLSNNKKDTQWNDANAKLTIGDPTNTNWLDLDLSLIHI